MERGKAYLLLSAAIAEFQAMEHARLVAMIGENPIRRKVRAGPDEFELEFRVYWADNKRRKLKVSGACRGMSVWHIELLEEHVFVEIAGNKGLAPSARK